MRAAPGAGRAPVEPIDARLLAGAWPHRPIEVHARALGPGLGLSVEAASRRLTALAERGLLVTREALRRAIEARPIARGGPIESLAIITHDRPACLARCLDGHRRAAEAHGRALDIAVVDDSIDPRAQAQNRAIAEAGSARYVGLTERATRDARLAFLLGAGGSVPPAAAVGANRNAALLFARGARLVSVDDDTTARVMIAGPSDALSITRSHDPTELWFHRSVDFAIERARFDAGADPIALHERMLGWSLSALSARATSVETDHASAALLDAIVDRGGHVAVTALGVVGDSGMGSEAYLLGVEGASQQRLLAAGTIDPRAVWRWAPVPTVSSGAYLMGLSMGIELGASLPPFFPYGRNQDGLFAGMIRAADADAYVGHLPAGVEHAPPAPGRFDGEVTRLADAVMACLERASGVEALGRHLAQVAASPDALVDRLIAARASRLVAQRRRLESALDTAPEGAPEAWIQAVATRLDAIGAAASDLGPALPLRWAEEMGVSAAGARFAALLARYGEAVEAWPSLLKGRPG